MSRSVYVASPEGLTGKSAVALGLLDALVREVGLGRGVPPADHGRRTPARLDLIVDLLVSQPGDRADVRRGDRGHLRRRPRGPRRGAARDRRAVRAAGRPLRGDPGRSARTTPTSSTGTELSFNAKIAANLGSPVVLVVHGRERTPEQVRAAADSAIAELRANHAQTVAVIANRVEAADAGRRSGRAGRPAGRGDAAIPESPLLSAPTFRALVEAADARAGAGQRSLDGPGVARADRGRDEPAQRAGAAGPRRHRDRAERPHRPDPRADAGPPVRHLPDAGRHPADRRLRAARDHPAAVRGRPAGPADRAHRPRHVRHRRAAAAGARADDQGLGEQDRDGPAAVRRAGRPGRAAGRDRRVGVRGAHAADVRVPADGAGPGRPPAHRAAGEPATTGSSRRRRSCSAAASPT